MYFISFIIVFPYLPSLTFCLIEWNSKVRIPLRNEWRHLSPCAWNSAAGGNKYKLVIEDHFLLEIGRRDA
jgi:hypothetical protein